MVNSSEVLPEEESDSVRLSAPITGFVDYNPKQQYLFNNWMEEVRNTFASFGFTALHLRPFERLQALKGEGDTQKQIFEVYRADTGKSTGFGLPFDHTVPLALWIAEHAGHLQSMSFPYKRYDLGLSFRGERPKTGRFRAFVQADVDIVGKKLGLTADAECILAILKALQKLDIGDFKVQLNHIGIVKSLLKKRQIPESQQAAVLRVIDKLDKISPQEASEEILRIEGFSLSMEETKNLIACFMTKIDLADASQGIEFGEEAAQGIEDIRKLIELFRIAGIEPSLFVFTPSMVRGLAYYTGIVFETVLLGKEHYGSIASGGRYSNLVGEFAKGLGDIEGVGGSIGLSRLFDIFCKTGMAIPEKTTMADILVGTRTQEQIHLAYRLSDLLRKKGLRVDMYSGTPKVKQILSHANALGINYTALVMDENAIVIKDMASQIQKEFLSIEDAIGYFP